MTILFKGIKYQTAVAGFAEAGEFIVLEVAEGVGREVRGARRFLRVEEVAELVTQKVVETGDAHVQLRTEFGMHGKELLRVKTSAGRKKKAEEIGRGAVVEELHG